MMVSARSGHRGDTYERLLRQERLILDVTELLTEALGNSGVTRAELARRLGRTPGFVSQVLGGGRNLTLRTIADIAEALALRPSFELTSDRVAVSNSAEWTHRNWHWTPPPRQVAETRSAGPGSAADERDRVPLECAA